MRQALKAASLIGLIVVGVPGNLGTFLLFWHLFFVRGHMPHNELILSQLVFANLMVTLCQGIPHALTASGINPGFSSQVCKTIIFIYRVGRAMSITTTALLSSYQCVVMAPSTSGWAWLKRWLPHHLPHIIIFLYVLSFIIYQTAILHSEAFPVNGTFPKFTFNLEFCIVVFPSPMSFMVNNVLFITQDFLFVSLMAAAAVYVMLVLHRHRQQVQVLQGASRKTEEASRSVLLLVSTYVTLFSLDNILWYYSLSVSHIPEALMDTRILFDICYSTFSPVLIIATNKKLAMYFHCGSKCKAAKTAQSNRVQSLKSLKNSSGSLKRGTWREKEGE